jgi:hypothetical protein
MHVLRVGREREVQWPAKLLIAAQRPASLNEEEDTCVVSG